MVTNVTSYPTLTTQTSTKDMGESEANIVRLADRALNSLVNNPQLLKTLADSSSTYLPVNRSAVQSILWALMNEDGGGFITKEGVQRAVLAEGGGTAQVDALWSKISPDGYASISAGEFATNSYIITAVTDNIGPIREAINQMRIDAANAENSSNIMDYLMGGAKDNILENFGGGTGTVLDLFS